MKKLLFFVALIFLSCGGYKSENAGMASDTLAPASTDLPSADLYSDGTGELIKTAELRFQVKDLKKSKEILEQSIKKYSAFIELSDLRYEHPMLEEQLTIRLLSISFEPLLREVEGLAAYINFRKVKSDDVAKEFVDLESRLKSKREMQQRYSEILRTKATTTEDVLKAEAQIGKLHEEIDAVMSQLNFLRDQVRHSTIKIEMYQLIDKPVASSKDDSTPSEFLIALKTGWQGFISVLITMIYVWPIVLFGGGAWVYIRMKRGLKIL